MRRRRAQLAAALLLITASPASAATGTLSGKVTDGKLPPPASGRVLVQAVSVPDGTIAAAASATRAGAWKLGVAPGSYVLTTVVVRADRKVVTALAPVQRVRSGRATRTNISLKRTRTPKPRRRKRGARAAATPTAAIGVEPFAGSGPNAFLGRGLSDMLVNSLVNATSGDCQPVVVEVEHRQAILDEIALSNSQFADPRMRMNTNALIDPAILVRGTVTTTATTTTWALEMVDAQTGDVVGDDSGTANGTDVLDAPAGIAQRIMDQLCAEYRIRIEVNATITIPPYLGQGIATADFQLKADPFTVAPTSWSGQDSVVFSGLQYGGVEACVVTPGPHFGVARAQIKRTGPNLIELTWGGDTPTSTDLVCSGKDIPDGVPPIMPFQGTQPTIMTLPASGGTFSLSGGLAAPGGAWVNTGTVTVTRVEHGAP